MSRPYLRNSLNTYGGDRFPGPVESGSLISAVSDLPQSIGPRLTAHQNDQHGKPEVANLPESGIRPLVSCARAKRGRDGARRSGEAGRASSKKISHLISDACMDAKYGRTREIFDRSPPYMLRGRQLRKNSQMGSVFSKIFCRLACLTFGQLKTCT